MINLLLSSLYRLSRDRRLWFALALVTAVEVVGAAGSWFAATPAGAALNPGSSYDLTVTLTNACTASSPVCQVVCCVLAAALAAEDGESGFAKTLLPFCRSRAASCAARLVAAGVVVAALHAATFLVAVLAHAALGFDLVAEPAWRVAGYLGAVTLQALAYALLSMLVTWATRSKAAGVAVGVLVGGTLAGAVAQLVLASLATGVPAAADLALWLPSWAQTGKLLILGADALFSAAPVAGTSAAAHVALVAGLWSLGAAACALMIESWRDVV